MSRIDQEQSPFETVSGVTMSRKDRLLKVYDAYVYTPFSVAWTDLRTRIGLILTVFYGLMGTVGVTFVDPPSTTDGSNYIRMFETMQFPLGTDMLGRDIAALIIHATPAMLKMIISGAVFALLIGGIMGIVAGYRGGKIDRVIMTITDIIMTLPGLPLLIVISAIFEPRSPFTVGIILSITAWAGLARALRSEVLKLRSASYVEAARIMGLPIRSIIVVDLVPNLMPFISIKFVGAARRIIFGSVALYFLGVLPISTVNWGVMLNEYYKNGALSEPSLFYMILWPMLAIVTLSLGLTLLAQGMDRVFNPRIRARHAKRISSEERT